MSLLMQKHFALFSIVLEIFKENTTGKIPPPSYIKLAKTSVSWGLRKLIVWRNISSVIMSLYLSKPNKRMSDNISSFKLFKEASILNKLLGVFVYFLRKTGNARRSGLLFQLWSVVSLKKNEIFPQWCSKKY